ncbi:MAG: right-handed parallel beta-helix repeat-containing protein [Parvularculaceae bacterium]
MHLVRAVIGVFAAFAALSPAFAQATRTWVSGVGDDANPCSRTAPCKTFAGAISKTADGGEINVLDPGGYGGVTITKSISIIADGDLAGIAVSGTNGIIVNAASAKVLLQGLDIDGTATSLNGIRVLAGDVHIEDCLIRGFTSVGGAGISMEATSPSRVFVSNSSIYYNTFGIRVVQSGGNSAGILVDNSRIDRNSSVGVSVDGALTVAILSNSIMLGQGPDVQALNGGQIISYGNNQIFTGSPTSTLPQK